MVQGLVWLWHTVPRPFRLLSTGPLDPFIPWELWCEVQCSKLAPVENFAKQQSAAVWSCYFAGKKSRWVLRGLWESCLPHPSLYTILQVPMTPNGMNWAQWIATVTNKSRWTGMNNASSFSSLCLPHLSLVPFFFAGHSPKRSWRASTIIFLCLW